MKCSIICVSSRVPAGPGYPGYPSPPTGPPPPTDSSSREEEESSSQPNSVPQERPLETPPTSADQFTPDPQGGTRRRTIAVDSDDTDELTDLRQRRLQRFNSEPAPVPQSIREELSAKASSNTQSSTSKAQSDSNEPQKSDV